MFTDVFPYQQTITAANYFYYTDITQETRPTPQDVSVYECCSWRRLEACCALVWCFLSTVDCDVPPYYVVCPSLLCCAISCDVSDVI